MPAPLTLALPKGRLLDPTLQLLSAMGIQGLESDTRRLLLADATRDLRFIFLKPADIPTYVLIPSFMISELKTAFQMGFLILLPFVVIDMVVSTALMSMGMMMLPPTTISLPFKVLLFVMADGWYLITRSLVTSFSVTRSS